MDVEDGYLFLHISGQIGLCVMCVHGVGLTHGSCSPPLQLFIKQHSYPKFTPATVVTEHGETEEFSSHFPCWPLTDLSLSSSVTKLSLPQAKEPAITCPATGQMKVYICCCKVYLQCMRATVRYHSYNRHVRILYWMHKFNIN